MNAPYLRRRAFLLGGLAAGAGARLKALPTTPQQTEASDANPLDRFIHRYLLAMNAPGLTLGLADERGAVRTAAFGYSDLERKLPVSPDMLFEIGSITKSFTALIILQLSEEKKLELGGPVLDYLPWLPVEANYGRILIHHLLTHTSGLPDALGLFLSDPSARHIQASRPGEQFHYCNAGFAALGHVIEKLDNRPYAESVRVRIFEPLGMKSSFASITNASLARRPVSYVPYFDDLVYPREGKLVPAPNLVFDDAAGCILSTPGDMTHYMQMLLRRGAAPSGRIVSEQSFTLFSKPYIKAPEFSSTASYGYGIAVDQLDGHTILRHTGGMVSFASAMHVDLDAGVAAFASINAMQGFRPNPVTQFAIQNLRAQKEHKPLPAEPALPDPAVIQNASAYAGVYRAPDGRTAELQAEGDHLSLRLGDLQTKLEQTGERTFIAQDTPALQRFPFVFARAAQHAASGTPDHQSTAPFAELRYGSDWFINEHYSGPKEYAVPPELARFSGYYRSGSPWAGSVRVVVCKGKLWLDGVAELEPLGDRLFRVGDEPHSPETAEFFYMVEDKARLLKLSGGDFWRVEAQ
jgi:D-alanyl-D-alanine carboxypeptidase